VRRDACADQITPPLDERGRSGHEPSGESRGVGAARRAARHERRGILKLHLARGELEAAEAQGEHERDGRDDGRELGCDAPALARRRLIRRT
jgi:hypothetical protein